MDELISLYSHKERIVLYYQYPAMVYLKNNDADPLQIVEYLKQNYASENTVLIGVSHHHPKFLKSLQSVVNDHIRPKLQSSPSKSKLLEEK